MDFKPVLIWHAKGSKQVVIHSFHVEGPPCRIIKVNKLILDPEFVRDLENEADFIKEVAEKLWIVFLYI